MTKAKNKVTVYVILALIGAVLIYFYTSGGIPLPEVEEPVPTGTSEGGLELDACLVGPDGKCSNRVMTSASKGLKTVEFQGETSGEGYRWVRIFSHLTKSGTVPEIVVTDITSTPSAYSTAINSGPQGAMDKDFTLTNAAPKNDQYVDIDMQDESIPHTPFSYTTFKMDVAAHFFDASGNQVSLSPTPSATVNIRKDYDRCSDSTPWGECSNSKPKYCNVGEIDDYTTSKSYAPGTLVDKASQCGCPAGQAPNGEVCVDQECQDGTSLNTCASPTPSSNSRYCKQTGDSQLVEACQLCGCVDDYYGNPSIGCSNPGATDGTDTCLYTEYTGSITIGIGSS